MNLLRQVDAKRVGSICINSNTYNSISDVFKMNNRNDNISNILLGRKTFVGKFRNYDCKNIAIKFCETRDYLIGTATCCGEKAYLMLPNKKIETTDFAWCYIDLLYRLANNIRCKIALSIEKQI